ncbi:MAG: hypothetical protein RLZZ387_4736 [Chloroflexota bacterium]|jgi:hypothetical protein
MASNLRARAVRELVSAALPFIVALAVAWGGWALGGGQRLDVGAAWDGPYVDAFYDREEFAGESYRWSKTDAAVRMPAVRAPAELEIRMAGRPGGVPLALVVDGLRMPEFDVAPLEFRRYRVLLPPVPHASDTSTIVFGAEAQRTPQDGRRLAVLVESVGARPLSGPPDAPPLPTLLSLLVFALALWAVLRLGGGGPALASAGAALLTLGLGAAWGGARLYVGPYLPAAATAALAGGALVAGLRLGVGRREAGAPAIAATVAAAAGVIPLTLALAGQEELGAASAAAALLFPLGLALTRLRGRAMTAVGTFAVLLAVAAAGAGLLAILGERDHGTAFHALHRAASRLWFGTMPLYNTTALAANPFASTFAGPPALAVLALPLVALPYASALVAWRLVSAALVLVSLALLLRAYRLPLLSWRAAALALLPLTLGPLIAALDEGRVSPLLLLLLSGGLLALSRGHDAALGVCFGAAAALHPPLLLLLGFLLAQRRWRALGAALAALALVTAAAVLVVGWPAHAVYVAAVTPGLLQSTGWVGNQSLHGFVHRLLAPEQLALRPAGGQNALAVAVGAALGLLALTAWLARRGGLRPDFAFGLWVTAALLVAPVTWAAEHVLLLLPLCIVAAGMSDGASGLGETRAGTAGPLLPWPALACLALGVALIAHGDPVGLADEVARGRFWGLALSSQLYGALLLYVAVVIAGRARSPAPAYEWAEVPPTAVSVPR